MNREIWKMLFWCSVITGIWILSMIHAEHNGMREQAAKDRQTLNCNGSGNINVPENNGTIKQSN